MKADLAAKLAALPPLAVGNAELRTPRCKICAASTRVFDIVDSNKCGGDTYNFYRFGFSGIPVCYYRCTRCRFLFTDFFDDWTNQDFADFIYNADYGKVDPEYASIRPKRCAAQVASVLTGAERLSILDYGSGAGVFAAELRAQGYAKCGTYDPFSSPEKPTGKFDVITCFEVMEHTQTPIETMRDIASYLGDAGCLIFSTGVQPPEIEQQRANWWYVSPRNGHLSIHTNASLLALAQACEMQFCPGSFGFAAMRRTNPKGEWNVIASRCAAPWHG